MDSVYRLPEATRHCRLPYYTPIIVLYILCICVCMSHTNVHVHPMQNAFPNVPIRTRTSALRTLILDLAKFIVAQVQVPCILRVPGTWGSPRLRVSGYIGGILLVHVLVDICPLINRHPNPTK